MGPVPTWTAGAHTGQVGQRLTSSECPLGLSSSGRFYHCASEKDPSPASLWPPPCWGSASSLQPPLDPAAPARPMPRLLRFLKAIFGWTEHFNFLAVHFIVTDPIRHFVRWF